VEQKEVEAHKAITAIPFFV